MQQKWGCRSLKQLICLQGGRWKAVGWIHTKVMWILLNSTHPSLLLSVLMCNNRVLMLAILPMLLWISIRIFLLIKAKPHLGALLKEIITTVYIQFARARESMSETSKLTLTPNLSNKIIFTKIINLQCISLILPLINLSLHNTTTIDPILCLNVPEVDSWTIFKCIIAHIYHLQLSKLLLLFSIVQFNLLSPSPNLIHLQKLFLMKQFNTTDFLKRQLLLKGFQIKESKLKKRFQIQAPTMTVRQN